MMREWGFEKAGVEGIMHSNCGVWAFSKGIESDGDCFFARWNQILTFARRYSSPSDITYQICVRIIARTPIELPKKGYILHRLAKKQQEWADSAPIWHSAAQHGRAPRFSPRQLFAATRMELKPLSFAESFSACTWSLPRTLYSGECAVIWHERLHCAAFLLYECANSDDNPSQEVQSISGGCMNFWRGASDVNCLRAYDRPKPSI